MKSPWLLITAGALLTAMTALGATDSPGRCAALKAKGAGVGLAGSLSCHAVAARKGASVSATCLDRAGEKLRRLFVKAEAKGACGAPGDAATIGANIASFAAATAAGLFPAAAPDTARRCAAKKLLRAGAYGRGRLACWGQAFRAGLAVDSQCFATAGSKLVVGFRAAERKPGCATTGDTSSVEDALDAFLDEIASSVNPQPVSTTTIVSVGTTSTDPGSTPTTTVVGQPPTTTSSTSPAPTVSFSADVQPIFTASCALAGCHGGPSPEEGLDLRAGRSYARLVNVDSRECGQFKRVRPGRPDASYLVFKLAGPPQACFSGDRMPDDAPPLAASVQDLIRTWIAEGAPNN